MTLQPREAAKFIAESSTDIKINDECIKKLGNVLIEEINSGALSVETFCQKDVHPSKDDPKASDWIFVVDTLNFCFWSNEQDEGWTVDGFTGYFALCAAINRAVKEKVDILNPTFYSTITEKQLDTILRSDNIVKAMASVSVPEQKIILCGEYGVGKSSIFRRFANDCFVTSSDRKSTLGLDHYDKVYKVHDKNIKLQLWDTGGMERVASITSSYYKFSEAAILVFSFDNPVSFHVLSQHLLDIVTYAENAKIFLCGNKSDLVNEDTPQISDADIEAFCEQCHSLIVTTYRISCKTGDGMEEMFSDIATHLVHTNRSKIELQSIEQHGFKLNDDPEELVQDSCTC